MKKLAVITLCSFFASMSLGSENDKNPSQCPRHSIGVNKIISGSGIKFIAVDRSKINGETDVAIKNARQMAEMKAKSKLSAAINSSTLSGVINDNECIKNGFYYVELIMDLKSKQSAAQINQSIADSIKRQPTLK